MLKKLFLIAFMLSLAGCTDKSDINVLNGQFSGIFIYGYPGIERSVSAGINFTGNRYSPTGNALGSGSFTVLKNILADFKDKNY